MKDYFTLLFLLCCTFIQAQSIEQKLEKHQSTYHLEKIYISHNQPHYAPGDTLYAKVFLVNGRTHEYFEGTPIIYLDWITEGGIIQESHILKIENGASNLSIPIPRDAAIGKYTLRAYTQYQKNFDEAYIFQKEIKIIGEEVLTEKNKIGDITDFSLRFFPEEGYLVADLKSTVAFKAQNGKGESIDIQGTIINEAKESIASFKTYNEGIGIFNFQPEAGKKYQAKVNWNGLIRFFDLPTILKKGFVLKANARKKDKITLQLASNSQKGLEGCLLLGHIRGQIFLNQNIQAGNIQNFSFEKSEIPSGVLHFTLFDAQGQPVSERLVFNQNPKEEIVINIDIPKTNFTTKELVKAEVSGKKAMQTIEGDFTISVFNKEVFSSTNKDLNIKNYLLLQSDLRGHINNINQYFEKDDTKSRTLLDYLMLTHGWRRFNWLDVLEEKSPPIIYPTEENISFAGKIKKDNNKAKPVKADVFLNIMDEKNFTSANLTTEEDGLFYFKGFDLPDSTEILLQANIHNPKKKKKLKEGLSKRTGNKNVQIELLDLAALHFNDSITLRNTDYNKEEQLRFAKEVNTIRKIDTIYHPEWTINLDAITVKAQKLAKDRKREADLKKKYKDLGLFYSGSSQKLYMDDLAAGGAIYNNIYDIIRARVPGVSITNTNEGKQVLLRGQSSIQNPTYASIELNGVIISSFTAESIIPEQIDIIDVKKGLSTTAIYGEAGNGGVISIITKNPKDLTREVYVPGILRVEHYGYHKARTFYAPDYTNPLYDKEKPDYRTTLYWNSDLKLTQALTPFEFYTGDKLSEFLIRVEGISKEGIPFIGHQIIKIGK